MAASLNKVMLIGNLGADPVIRQTQDGKRLAQLSLATSESWKDKATGEKKEKTTDQSGVEKYPTEIVLGNYNGTLTMLDSRNSGGGDSIPDMGSDINQDMGDSAPPDLDIDDEIPF